MFNKILVLALIWFGIGCLVQFIPAMYWLVKLIMLDPHDKDLEVIDDFEELFFEGFLKVKGEKDEDIKNNLRDLLGGSLLLAFIRDTMTWPNVIAYAFPKYRGIYETLKNEYDTGIRTRKSPQ